MAKYSNLEGTRKDLFEVGKDTDTVGIGTDTGIATVTHNGEVARQFEIPEDNIYYVGKHGNDSNDGKTMANAFESFTAAIAAVPALSGALGWRIVCQDARSYAENNLQVKAFLTIDAPGANLIGNVILEDNSGVSFGIIQTTGSSGAAVSKTTGTGQAEIKANHILALGADNAISCSSGSITVDINGMTVGSGYGLYATTGGVVGGIMGSATLSSGVWAKADGENSTIGFIAQSTTGAGTAIEATDRGTVQGTIGVIQCTTAWNVDATSTMNITASTVLGTRTVASGATYSFVTGNQGLDIDGRIKSQDDVATPPYNATMRSLEPTTPQETGDLYLDDGTNTSTGYPNWRNWNGVEWIDVGYGVVQSGGSSEFPPVGEDGLFYWNSDISTMFQWAGGIWKPMISYQAVTMYVNGTLGADIPGNGYGSGASAFATIQYAIDNVPAINGGDVIINVAGGTYAENIKVQGKAFAVPATLKVLGELSVVDTGTVNTAYSGNQTDGTDGWLTCTGKTWTTDEHKGKLAYDSTSGNYALIRSNTADQLNVIGNGWANYIPVGTFTIYDRETEIVPLANDYILDITGAQQELYFDFMRFYNNGIVTSNRIIQCWNYSFLVLRYSDIESTGKGVCVRNAGIIFGANNWVRCVTMGFACYSTPKTRIDNTLIECNGGLAGIGVVVDGLAIVALTKGSYIDGFRTSTSVSAASYLTVIGSKLLNASRECVLCITDGIVGDTSTVTFSTTGVGVEIVSTPVHVGQTSFKGIFNTSSGYNLHTENSDANTVLHALDNGQIGIGTDTPVVDAILDVSSMATNPGAFLVPRITTAERTALTASNGMVVYDTDLNSFQFYENSAWGTK